MSTSVPPDSREKQLERENDFLHFTVRELKSKISAMEGKISVMDENSKQTIQMLQSDFESATSEKERLLIGNTQLSIVNTDMKEKIEVLEAELKALRADDPAALVEPYRHRVTELELKLEKMHMSYAELQMQLDKEHKLKDDLRRSHIKAMDAMHKKHISQLKEKDDHISAADIRIREMKEEIDRQAKYADTEIREHHTVQRQIVAENQEELETSRRKLFALHDTIRKMEDEMDERERASERARKEYKQGKKTLEDENKSFRIRITELSSELEKQASFHGIQMKNLREEMKKQIKRQGELASDGDKSLQSMKLTCEDLRQQIADLNEQQERSRKTLQNERREHEAREKHLKDENSAYLSRISELSSEIEKQANYHEVQMAKMVEEMHKQSRGQGAMASDGDKTLRSMKDTCQDLRQQILKLEDGQERYRKTLQSERREHEAREKHLKEENTAYLARVSELSSEMEKQVSFHERQLQALRDEMKQQLLGQDSSASETRKNFTKAQQTISELRRQMSEMEAKAVEREKQFAAEQAALIEDRKLVEGENTAYKQRVVDLAAEMQKQATFHEAQIKDMEGEMHRQHSDGSSHRLEVEKLLDNSKHEISDLKEKIKEYEASQSAKERAIQLEREQLNETRKAYEEENRAYISRVSELTSEIKKQGEFHEEQTAKMKKESKQLEAECSRLKILAKSTEDGAQSASQELLQQIKELTLEKTALEEAVEGAKHHVSLLDSEMSKKDYEEENRAYISRVSELTSEIKKQGEFHEEQTAKMKKESKQLEAECSRLKILAKSTEDGAQSASQELLQQIKELTLEKTALEEAVEGAKHQVSLLDSEMSKLTTSCDSEIARYKTENESLRAQLEIYSTQQQEMAKLRKGYHELGVVEEKFKMLQKSSDTREEELKERVSELKAEISDLRSELRAERVSADDAQRKVKELEGELKTQDVFSKGRLKVLTDEKANLLHELSELQAKQAKDRDKVEVEHKDTKERLTIALSEKEEVTKRLFLQETAANRKINELREELEAQHAWAKREIEHCSQKARNQGQESGEALSKDRVAHLEAEVQKYTSRVSELEILMENMRRSRESEVNGLKERLRQMTIHIQTNSRGSTDDFLMADGGAVASVAAAVTSPSRERHISPRPSSSIAHSSVRSSHTSHTPIPTPEELMEQSDHHSPTLSHHSLQNSSGQHSSAMVVSPSSQVSSIRPSTASPGSTRGRSSVLAKGIVPRPITRPISALQTTHRRNSASRPYSARSFSLPPPRRGSVEGPIVPSRSGHSSRASARDIDRSIADSGTNGSSSSLPPQIQTHDLIENHVLSPAALHLSGLPPLSAHCAGVASVGMSALTLPSFHLYASKALASAALNLVIESIKTFQNKNKFL
ncbi:hypothetical protein ADUPG1_011174, partial [Aduncisulcus paluster]